MVGGRGASGVWFSCESAGREISRTRGGCLFWNGSGFDRVFLPEKLPSPRMKFPKGKEGNVKPYGGGLTPLKWLKSGELELSSEDMMLSRDDGKSYTGLLRFTISVDARHKASVKTVGKTKTEVEE
jgi:hypothetical protein